MGVVIDYKQGSILRGFLKDIFEKKFAKLISSTCISSGTFLALLCRGIRNILKILKIFSTIVIFGRIPKPLLPCPNFCCFSIMDFVMC